MIESLIAHMTAYLQNDQMSLFWGVLGIALVVLEMLAPGFFLLWLGLAAIVTAGIVHFFTLPTILSWVLFSVLSLVFLLLTRHMYKHLFQFTSHATLNKRGAEMIGKTYTLDEPIKNGKGRLRIGDSMWAIQGDDLDAGDVVVIKEIEGNHLVVEKKS